MNNTCKRQSCLLTKQSALITERNPSGAHHIATRGSQYAKLPTYIHTQSHTYTHAHERAMRKIIMLCTDDAAKQITNTRTWLSLSKNKNCTTTRVLITKRKTALTQLGTRATCQHRSSYQCHKQYERKNNNNENDNHGVRKKLHDTMSQTSHHKTSHKTP